MVLKFYLENLELAGFIQSYTPFNKSEGTKLKRYKLVDEYLRFYLKFVKPNKKIISQQTKSQILFQRLVKSKWDFIYQRTDKVITLCEIKYSQKLATFKIIAEVQKKCSFLKLPRGFTLEKALITVHGAETSVRESEYFDHILELKN